jgi:carbonic anhydrase
MQIRHLWITIFLLIASPIVSTEAGATVAWTKLNENNQSKLSIDKQSIIEKDQLKKAWLKIEYKTPQKNLQEPEKLFNLSKVLWYFDCPAQKSATSQVVQYLNDEMVFSAGIDAKKAEFIEPVPETDVDVAMRFVCAEKKPAPEATTKPLADDKIKQKSANSDKKETEKPEGNPEKTTESKPEKPEVAPAKTTKPEEKSANNAEGKKNAASSKDAKKGEKTQWSYAGDGAPEHWGKLNPEFALCDAGKSQSPINIEEPIKANLKKIRSIQKFPAKSIENTGIDIKLHFKEGNMMVLDNAPFQMKHIQFHLPSEHTLQGKSFPVEAQFYHADSKGGVTIVAVMFKEGKSNASIDKLFGELTPNKAMPVELKSRLIASELMPTNQEYFRYSGSLTTPPCSEGVRWVIMKNPLSISKEQIEKINKALKNANNRPPQALNGRTILE